MTKNRTTKRALLLSALSLLVCVSMLVGSTFAWFTDSVTSAGNIIKSGKLEVEMLWAEGQEDPATVTWKDASEGAIFNYEKWEPGFVQARHIKIENAGTLALKYQLTIEATDFDAAAATKLTDVIDVYFIDGAVQLADRTALAGVQPVGTLTQVLAGMPTNAAGDLLENESDTVTIALMMRESAGNEYQDKSIGSAFAVKLVATQFTAESDSFGPDYDTNAVYPVTSVLNRDDANVPETLNAGEVAVELPVGTPEGNYELLIPNDPVENEDENGNNVVSLEIKLMKDGEEVDAPVGVSFPVKVYVGENKNITKVYHKDTEVAFTYANGYISFETDSFSPFSYVYHSGVIESVEDAADLIVRGGEFKLESDLVLSETLVIPEGEEIVLDLNGKTITGNIHKSIGAVIKNEGTLTIKNGVVTSAANNGGSAIASSGVLVVENMTLNGAPNADGSWPAYTVNNTGDMTATNTKITSYHGAVASYNEGAIVALNNCEIDMAGIPGFTNHGIYTYNNGAVVVNGGTYANKAADQNSTGASVINGAVTVNAGTFSGRIENYYGTPVIQGGSFSVKPNAKFVVAGYSVVESNGAYVVLAGTAVSTADQLIEALAANKDVVFTNDIKIEPAAMSNAYGTTGINIKNGQTLDGNGYTLDIKGAGGTWDSGINTTGGVIKNLKVTGSFRGVFVNHTSTYSETVVLENVTIDGTVYTISCDQALNQNLVAKNSTFNGWTSYADTIGTAAFEDCSFGQGSGYKFMRPYAPTTYVGCDFCEGYRVDPLAAVSFENCTLNGEPLTAENIGQLVTTVNNVTVK